MVIRTSSLTALCQDAVSRREELMRSSLEQIDEGFPQSEMFRSVKVPCC